MDIEIGKNYYIETVTHYWVGRVVAIDGPSAVTIEDFAWVASTGRYHQFLSNPDTYSIPSIEIEAAPDGMQKRVSFISIQPWPFELLRRTVPA